MKSANSRTLNQAGRLAAHLLGALAFFGLYAFPVPALADPPALNLAQDPLFNSRGNVHPNLILDLSVEFPTVGAAYRTAYNPSKEYLGYFNPKKCYTYPTNVTGATHSSTTSGTAVVNTTATPNATTTTTATSADGYTTTTTTVTDVVTSAAPAYTATLYATVSSGRLFTSSGTNRKAVYTTFNSSTGVLGSLKYYCASNCGSGGTYVSNNTKLWDYPQTAVLTPRYTHTPTTTVTTTVGIPYPDLSENGYFSILKDATANHECEGGDSFSGNFMNWASSSSIDMLRYALTGGDRVIDTATETVLQRAYLPDGSYNGNSNFYANSTYFPRKSITNASTVTPFTADTLYVVSCRDRILFSNTNNGGTCDTARVSGSGSSATLISPTDKYFGEYRARVKVCDSNEGPTRSDLCSKYGSNYKPEGNLQRYSDKIRAGAFGYLTGSHVDNLYGGVLRAPAKYVGPKKFEAPSFAQATNSMSEWDADTGVFFANPLNDSAGSSGVINYLNKFGRTNPSRLGAYKTKDPVSELYYESLRYLQGRQPTNDGSDATSAIKLLGSSTSDDNFPVKKTWDDPITASCQSNYAVVIGDVNTHQDGYIPGSGALGSDSARAADDASPQWPALNVATWSQKISDMERNVPNYETVRNPAPRTNLTSLDTSLYAGSNNGTYNFSGLAYWANTNDIRRDKPVRVNTFVIDVDEGGNGSIEDTNPRTRKPRNSQFYLAAKYGGFNDKGDKDAIDEARKPDGNPFVTLDMDGVTKLYNQSEWTGTNNGTDPKNYFLASQPEKLISAIKDIFRVASSTSGTIGGVTLTSTNISTTSSAYVFQPGFDPVKWGGVLLKLELKLQADDTIVMSSPSSAAWDAGIVLTNAAADSTKPATRKIYTSYVDPEVGSIKSMHFKWEAPGGDDPNQDILNAEQRHHLNKSPEPPNDEDGLAEKRVNYLRGSRTDEIGQPNGVFRARDRVLGDIMNSNPTYVGKPSPYIDGEGYADFRTRYKDRSEAVYVGANDGMLHAINAADGTELFAYVPDAVLPQLSKLTSPAYVHRPYVDGMMNVSEVKAGSEWRTVLVSGMGAGAQGIFALDVSSPGAFSSGSMALWEFTDKNDPDMGNVYSRPVIAKFKRLGADGKPLYKTMVVVANGFNSSVDDMDDKPSTYLCPTIGADESTYMGARCNARGPGALFLLSLDKSKDEPWQRGVNYWKYPTPTDTAKANGLSAPALVAGRDGAIRYAYAGDLQGNLWRFDFTLPNAGNVAEPWDSVRSSDIPLFTAKDKDGNRQPITQEPRVVYAPASSYLVLFGTGKFLEQADTSSSGTQSFYAVYDTTFNADRVTGRGQLQERTAALHKTQDVDALTITGDPFDYGLSDGAKKGWYLDFHNSTSTGERSVTNSMVAYGSLFFNTLSMSNPCEKGGGRTYSLCTLSGLPLTAEGKCESGGVTGYLSTVGMLSSPILVTAGSATVTDRDSIGRRVSTQKYGILTVGTSGATIPPLRPLKAQTGRASWREVLNWQDLQSTARAK